MKLDRASPLPLYAQLHDELRRRLTAGDFDERFATDMELVAEYGVSRQTVREAVRKLTESGLLDRERGRGTRVRTFDHLGGGLQSFYEEIEAQGAVQRSVVVTREQATNNSIAAILGLPARAPLVHVARLRLADDEPIALDDAWLDAAVGAPLLTADLTRTGIYPELRAAHVDVDAGTEQITPVVPTPDERRALHLPARVAAFSIERVAHAGGRPIEWRRTLIRGDRYTITLSAGTAGLPWAPRAGAASAAR